MPHTLLAFWLPIPPVLASLLVPRLRLATVTNEHPRDYARDVSASLCHHSRSAHGSAACCAIRGIARMTNRSCSCASGGNAG
eukprot:3243211-Prymnesium_polylepis.1